MLGVTHQAVGLFGGGLSHLTAGTDESLGCKQPPRIYQLSPLRPQDQTPKGQAIHKRGVEKATDAPGEEANHLWIINV